MRSCDALGQGNGNTMTNYRLEAVRDAVTGKYCAVLYYGDGASPIGQTKPIYDSKAEALRRIDEMFRTALHSKGAAV